MVLLVACAENANGDHDGGADTDADTDLADTDAEPASGWRVAAPLPAPRQECGVVALGDEIVVVGGYDDAVTIVDLVEAYRPSTDTWRTLAPLPEPIHHPNVVVLDAKLHVAGALGAGFVQQNVHWIYDPATDDWTEGTPLPAARAVGAAGAAVLDGVIHLVGGLRMSQSVALHSTYDPSTDAWDALPDAPHARDHLGMAAVGSVLVATAGRDGGLSSFVAATDLYDPAIGWLTGAEIPTPRGGAAAAVLDGALHVFGGEGNAGDPSGVFATHDSYDPETDSWTTHDPMPSPRHGTGAATLDDTIWIPGGADVQAFGAVDTNEGWSP